ncbi:LOW QUALITY PROTEIN: hypothetical protein ElyMa_005818700 [Elysia marginata]|uniref:VWFD domain-containing protein n=1 Tax=Elysia marginata TaxID=1093978 RepID=A0AAV4FVS1_9GAST|nr:LOW QUALITY PROTEIN: hypothetical protein ElyMa_005818700 [Elysia marginata]
MGALLAHQPSWISCAMGFVLLSGPVAHEIYCKKSKFFDHGSKKKLHTDNFLLEQNANFTPLPTPSSMSFFKKTKNVVRIENVKNVLRINVSRRYCQHINTVIMATAPRTVLEIDGDFVASPAVGVTEYTQLKVIG